MEDIAHSTDPTLAPTLQDTEIGNQMKESLIEKGYLYKDPCLRSCITTLCMMILLVGIPLIEFGRACVSTTRMGVLFGVIWGSMVLLMIGYDTLFENIIRVPCWGFVVLGLLFLLVPAASAFAVYASRPTIWDAVEVAILTIIAPATCQAWTVQVRSWTEKGMVMISELRAYREYLKKQEEPGEEDSCGVWRRAAYMIPLKLQPFRLTKWSMTKMCLWTDWGRGTAATPIFSEQCKEAGMGCLAVIGGCCQFLAAFS
jgi:hypothetical protein